MKLHVPPRFILWTHTHTHILFPRYNATGMCASLASHVWLFGNLWIVACQTHLSMEFCRQESWSGLPFPPPRDLPTQGLNRSLLHLLYWQMHSLPLSHQGSPVMQHTILFIIADFFSWLKILQTEILMFSFLSWILPCSVDSEPFARLAQALVSWTALNHLLDLLLHVNHICDYCLLALQPSPTRGSKQSGIFSFPIQFCELQWGFFICLFVLLGGLWVGDWGCIFHTKHYTRYAII